MINSSETYIPEVDGFNDSQTVIALPNVAETYIDSESLYADSAEKPLQSAQNDEDKVLLSRGAVIGADYIVSNAMEHQGKQADVYVVRREGKVYVAKVYKREWQPSRKAREFFLNSNHPNLTRIVDAGKMLRTYYEVYEYYRGETLDQRKINSASFIKEIVIPSINNGLHELHSNGIIHCDIKPSNIFVAEDEQSVIIGDFGSCGVMGSDGTATIVLQGTPEYSAPVTAFYGQATVTPAYDYCSFGLVIYKLLTGHSLLGNMTTQEIARMWQKEIRLPSQITPQMEELLNGLLDVNPETRWGYKEVKRWCENEFVTKKKIVRRRRNETEEIKPLIFGTVGGEIVKATSITRLVKLMRENWDLAKVCVLRIETEYFVRGYNREAYELLKELKKGSDPDVMVFKLMYKLEMSSDIYYRGHNYGSLKDFIQRLSSECDDDAKDFVSTGLFSYYLGLRKADAKVLEQINRIVAQSSGKQLDITTLKTICYAFVAEKILQLGDNDSVASVEEFIDYLHRQSIAKIRQTIARSDVMAWLYTMGLGAGITAMSKMED
ncbi:MAG: protein kinase [Lachnospiraceae bacterium]|nr:protein kinase [Lachnospiraceae bacterium]